MVLQQQNHQKKMTVRISLNLKPWKLKKIRIKSLKETGKNKEPSPTKLPEKDDTNNQPIHKTPESNENNEGTEASVEKKETDAKAEEGTEDAVCKEDKTSKVKGKDEHSNYEVSGESKDKETMESKNKKVSFDMNVDTKIDTSSENIDAQNIIIQTGDGQNNGNNTISSDNTHILDDDLTPSQEIPLSQMPQRNPYIKDDDSNNSASNDLGSENDDNIEDTADSQCSDGTLYAEECEGQTEEQEEEQNQEEDEETDSSKKEDSENDDIVKPWLQFEEGHMLERYAYWYAYYLY